MGSEMPNPVIATLAATAALAAAASARKPTGSAATHPLVKVPSYLGGSPAAANAARDEIYRLLKDKATYVSATQPHSGNRHHYVYPSYDTARRWGRHFEAEGRKRVNVTRSKPRGFDKNQVRFDKWLTPNGDLEDDIKVATSRFGNAFIQVGTYNPVNIPLNQIYDDHVRRRIVTIAFRGNSIKDVGARLNTEQIERFIDFIRKEEEIEEKRSLYEELAWLISNPWPPKRFY
jgi:hypothetical protein